ncbi:MAG: hypothetical protein H8E18_07740 [FCB group bacterium]|nr:hypothetical protein [FCB group bacterium]
MSERALLIPASPLSSGRGISFISSENGAMINPSSEIHSNSICCAISWNPVLAKTALPGGYRNNNNGNFNNMGNNGYFWSATENNSNNAWNRKLNYNNSDINRNNNNKRNGFSVRLLRELNQSGISTDRTCHASPDFVAGAW